MKNYELDYAQSTHTTCQWSTSVAVMIKLYDFMIRDSLVLIITRSSITFFPLGCEHPPYKQNEIMPMVGHTFVYVNKV